MYHEALEQGKIIVANKTPPQGVNSDYHFQRDELIDALEKRMHHEVAIETLFTVRWEVIKKELHYTLPLR